MLDFVVSAASLRASCFGRIRMATRPLGRALALGLIALSAPVFAAQNSVQVPTGAPLPGLTLVNDLNSAALNYITLNSGSSAPSPSGLGTANTAGVIWHDTATNGLKVRDQADGAWVRFLDVDETNKVATPPVPVSAGASSVTVGASEHYGTFVATAAQSFTLAHSTTLWNGFAFSIFANAGAATVSVNGTDAINGGSDGVGITIPIGYFAEFSTDGAGNWYVVLLSAGLGAGSISSNATTDLCSIADPYLTITGSTTISSLGPSCQAGQIKVVKFSGALTLSYNSTSLILPGGANIAAAAGDSAIVVALGSSNYVVVTYQRANGLPVAGTAASPIVGLARGITALQTAAGASLTVTASQIVVATGITGAAADSLLSAYSETVNLSGTGAGGMDVTPAPTSDFADLYAIYNPSGPTISILACADATCMGAPTYPGAHMPGGYTQSALLAIWPTDGSGNLRPGLVFDRTFYYPSAGTINILSAFAHTSGWTSESIGAAVPRSARYVEGWAGNTTNSQNFTWAIAADGNGMGVWQAALVAGVSNAFGDTTFAGIAAFDVPITSPQTLYVQYVSTGVNSTGRLNVTGYRF